MPGDESQNVANPSERGTPEKPDMDSVDRLTEAQQRLVQETLSRVLETQRVRIEYAESRRGALATVGGVVLAAGLAGLLPVATATTWTYFPAWLGLLCITLSLVVTGVLTLIVYGRQTNWNYPFKPLTQTWKHFYRDAIPGAGEPSVPWHASQSRSFKSASERAFANIYPGYVERILSLDNPKVNLCQDMAQSYVLHWNEMYKNRFLTSLRKLVVVGIVCSVGLGIIGFVVGIVFAPDRFDAHAKPTAAAPLSQTLAPPHHDSGGYPV
jgi:hypothetical protein